MSPNDLELLARGAAIGGYLALAAVLLRASPRRARLTGVLFCLSAAAHTLIQMSMWESVVGPATPIVWMFSVAGAALFWAFPISTIALDAGFGSLGAFNRAFKEATGATPSVYRERIAPDDAPNLKDG